MEYQFHFDYDVILVYLVSQKYILNVMLVDAHTQSSEKFI